MRILMIRHGDPDYEQDTLTEKGHREAKLLAKRICAMHPGNCYVSPLGRAQATAAYSLERLNTTAPTLQWLQEFPAQVDIQHEEELQKAYPDTKKKGDIWQKRIVWDMVPGFLASHPEYTDSVGWRHTKVARQSDLLEVYDEVTRQFDHLLASYGYERAGRCYQVEQGHTKTATFFCHFGIICALLSHLWNISPFVLWHGLALPPTSVTEVVTEERQKGIVSFRALRLGDISHLVLGEEEPSFSARFCETYENMEQRH